MRVIIVGGGNVGTYTASELARAGHDVLIVEIDPARVAQAAATGVPDGVPWLQADGCEVNDFGRAQPGKADVVVAVTGDDEDNLVISLLAKQEFGVPRVVARINNPDNQWLFNETWGVDVSVSTPHLLTALVEEAVSVGSLVRLMSLGGDQARLAEIQLTDDSPVIGKAIAELSFPRGSTVVAILRSENVVVPRGDTKFATADEVMVLVTADAEEAVRRLFAGA